MGGGWYCGKKTRVGGGHMSYATMKAHDGGFTLFRSWMFGMSILFLGHEEYHEGLVGYAEEVLLRLYVFIKNNNK